MSVQHFNKETFAAAVQSGKPVLVDFWAVWCVPCQMFAPILDEVAAELGDSVIVGKINIDEFPSLAQDFRVMSIPTIVAIENGKETGRLLGAQPKDAVLSLLR